MPVVALSIQFLSDASARRSWSAILLIGLFAASGFSLMGSPATAQEPAAETGSGVTSADPPGEAGDPPTPVPDPLPAPADEGSGTSSEEIVVTAGCAAEVLAQQKLTRSIREIRNPLPKLANAEADKLKRVYAQLLSAGYTTPKETKDVQDYLGWVILRASDPEFSQSTRNMQSLIKDVRDDVARAGATVTGGPDRKERERKKFCGDVLLITRQLLDNNLDARLAAVTIMQTLYDVAAVQNGPKARLHADALATLLTVLGDTTQPDSVKVGVGSALRHILINCTVTEQEQFRICDAIGKELARPCTESAFQLVLIDTLYEISVARRTVGAPEPTALKIFAAILSDSSKPVEVRCHAARGIGHGPFDQQMKLEAFAWKIAQLAGEVSVEYSKNVGNARWPECGIDLLLAFRHLTPAPPNTPVLQQKGLMNRLPSSRPISEAAPFVTAVSIKLIENKSPFSVQELTPLAQWIQNNRPQAADLKWDTNAAAIVP